MSDVRERLLAKLDEEIAAAWMNDKRGLCFCGPAWRALRAEVERHTRTWGAEGAICDECNADCIDTHESVHCPALRRIAKEILGDE